MSSLERSSSQTIHPQPNLLIPVSERVVNFRTEFAIGRVQSVAAAGEAQARPSVRWGGLPGRRSHSSMTQWALGFISTVRIGAGAWRNLANTIESGDTDQAMTQIHGAKLRPRNRKKQEKTLLKRKTVGRSQGKKGRLTS